jgi:putative MFS transporter
MTAQRNLSTQRIFNSTVVISALGYFVDIYDLVVFGIVRVASLKELGVAENIILEKGIFLLNCQMIGMLIGGIFWGILGDKRGRRSILFGSIFLYSAANIANAYVHTLSAYGFWRFIAGLGLAGELGAAITLVCEAMPASKRGYGTGLVAAIGVSGAILAAIVSEFFHWRMAYIIGGVFGLLLLLVRAKMFESGMYLAMQKKNIVKGNFFYFFNSKDRFFRYLNSILIGLPIFFVLVILVNFAPEVTKALGVTSSISVGRAVAFQYAGAVIGDLISSWLSQYYKSRKKIIVAFMFSTAILSALFLTSRNLSGSSVYFIFVLLGLVTGYWALFITMGAEQFGSNLRNTAATTIPNFVRASAIPLAFSVQWASPRIGLLKGVMFTGAWAVAIGVVSLYFVRETFGKDLDHLET